jgi:hypothetical protein
MEIAGALYARRIAGILLLLLLVKVKTTKKDTLSEILGRNDNLAYRR